MKKILAISVLLGVTVMMMGSILPAMAEPSVDELCKVGDPTCGKGGKTIACEKIRELEGEGKVPRGTWEKVCSKTGPIRK